MKEVKNPKRPLIAYWVIVLVVLVLMNSFVFPYFFERNIEDVEYSTFLEMLDNKEISSVQKNSDYIYFTDTNEEDPSYYRTIIFAEDPDLAEKLHESGATFGRVLEKDNSFMYSLLSTAISVVIFIALGR